jgi:hypothetical protein
MQQHKQALADALFNEVKPGTAALDQAALLALLAG